MINSVRKYLHKNFAGHTALMSILFFIAIMTISLRGTGIAGLVAAATSSLTKAPVVFYFTPYDDETIQVGETRKIDININTRVPVNAIGITVKFPEDTMEVVGFSKEKSFLDLWTEETAIKEEVGEVHFSGGTVQKGGLLGTSTALTLTVRAKKSGEARLSFKGTEVFASDGQGVSIDSDTRDLMITIPEAEHAPVIAGGGGGGAPERPLPRSADLNGDGAVNLIDVSIMVVRIFGPYDARFDIDMDGTVGLSDLSVLLSKMGS